MMLKVKINTHGNPLPEKHGECYDLAVPESVILRKGAIKVIDFQISVKPPEGYYIKLYSRSSTPLRTGMIIANGVGIIESNYCGDNDHLGLVVCATKSVMIPAGTRLAQFTIEKKPPEFEFEQVDTMGEDDRGGYGSTGV